MSSLELFATWQQVVYLRAIRKHGQALDHVVSFQYGFHDVLLGCTINNLCDYQPANFLILLKAASNRVFNAFLQGRPMGQKNKSTLHAIHSRTVSWFILIVVYFVLWIYTVQTLADANKIYHSGIQTKQQSTNNGYD